MGFDLGHTINSLAKQVLRAKRVADKNKAEEQNVEEEVRKKFFEWLDWGLSSKNIDKVVAFHFNIYEDGENIWSLELVGTSEFSVTDSDWACAEMFATRSHPFKITYSEPWQEVLALFKKYVNSYLEIGTLREVLKSKAGVGIGFVDGDLEILYENPFDKMQKCQAVCNRSNIRIGNEMVTMNFQEVLEAFNQIDGWKLVTSFSVGGFEWIGFSKAQPGQMLCISSSKTTVLNCENGALEECGVEYDETKRIAVCKKLSDEKILIAGQYGGELPLTTENGDLVVIEETEEHIKTVYFVSAKGEKRKIFCNYGMYICGFNYDGNYFVLADDAGIAVIKRRNKGADGDLFWNTMELCDWNSEGDDDKVLAPVIKHLSEQSDSVIFEFDDLMSELLYHLDTKKLVDLCQKEDPQMCDDTFLYSRCVALVNGRSYYEKVRQGKEKGLWSMEFEALLYVPEKAWALKHKRSIDDYPHSAPFSYETGSNKDGWK